MFFFKFFSGNWCQTANCAVIPTKCGISLFPEALVHLKAIYINNTMQKVNIFFKLIFLNLRCGVSAVKSYCPKMCASRSCTCQNNIDQCLNGGIFNTATCSCSCPTGFSGTVCETLGLCTALTCQNSGVYNAAKCKCDCFSSYAGNSCELLLCNVPDPSYCVNFNKIDCVNVPIVYSYCPNLCSR